MSGMAPNDGARPRLVIMIQAHISRVNCIEIKLNVESVKMNSQIFSMEFTKKITYVLPNYKFLVEFKLAVSPILGSYFKYLTLGPSSLNSTKNFSLGKQNIK